MKLFILLLFVFFTLSFSAATDVGADVKSLLSIQTVNSNLLYSYNPTIQRNRIYSRNMIEKKNTK